MDKMKDTVKEKNLKDQFEEERVNKDAKNLEKK